jgi:hypothetical protein
VKISFRARELMGQDLLRGHRGALLGVVAAESHRDRAER